MRYIHMMFFAVALLALPAASNAAPRTIDDCEKIQAADAYNQCLAVFGPAAHTRGVTHDSGVKIDSADDGADATDATPATGRAASTEPRRHGRHAHAHGHYRHHASRHGWSRHGAAGHHGHGRRTGTAQHHHAGAKRLQFSVISGHTKLR